MSILSLNSGSSSLKFSLFEEESLLAEGAIERIGIKEGLFWVQKKERLEEKHSLVDHSEALAFLFDKFSSLQLPHPEAVGHRIVHGGKDHYKPEKVNSELIDKLKELIPFSPLHLPSEIEGIKGVQNRFKNMSQVACFDTAFHHQVPDRAKCYPIPYEYFEKGIRKYGFHDLSYEYILSELKPKKEKVIICHLGNGASAAATIGNQPMDTSMGFTPLGGFMMGTRCGDLDPGLLLYLMNEKKMSSEEIEELLDHQSGLLGISGITSDMRDLIDQKEKERAEFAIELFCYQIRKSIASFVAVLDGLDILVFTAGIGENVPLVREKICNNLSFLEVDLDLDKNQKNEGVVSSKKSKVQVMVIPTDEDLMIARHTREVLEK